MAGWLKVDKGPGKEEQSVMHSFPPSSPLYLPSPFSLPPLSLPLLPFSTYMEIKGAIGLLVGYLSFFWGRDRRIRGRFLLNYWIFFLHSSGSNEVVRQGQGRDVFRITAPALVMVCIVSFVVSEAWVWNILGIFFITSNTI